MLYPQKPFTVFFCCQKVFMHISKSTKSTETTENTETTETTESANKKLKTESIKLRCGASQWKVCFQSGYPF